MVLNPSAGSQSAKDIDPYFTSQLYVKDPGQQEPVLILPNGLRKLGERAHDRNLTSAMGGIRSTKALDRQSSVLPLSYSICLLFIINDKNMHANALNLLSNGFQRCLEKNM